jgi:hypothetical protein
MSDNRGVVAFTKWSSLRRLTKSPVFAGSGTVLVIGSLAAAGFERAQQWFPTAAPPLMFKVAFLGSLIGVGAVGLFEVFCPAIIKRFDGFEAYRKDQWDVYLNALDDNKASAILANVTELSDGEKARLRALRDKHRARTLSAGEDAELKGLKDTYFRTAVQYNLNKLWETADVATGPMRVLIVVFLGLGAALTGGVFIYRAFQLLML